MSEVWWRIRYYGPRLLREIPGVLRYGWAVTWQDGRAYAWQNCRGLWAPDWLWESPFGRVLCEMQGHPPGVVWYNAGGYEPDMRCKRCGKDLG